MKTQLAAVQYSEHFKNVRKSKKMTQKQLANLLGISQATVSLIEAGQKIPGEEIYRKFQSIFSNQEISINLNANTSLSPLKEIPTKVEIGRNRLVIAGWQITRGNHSGGDIIEVHKVTNSETLFFVADAVGHGDEGYREAQLIKVAFNSIITALPKITSTASIIEYVQQGLRKAGSAFWSRHSFLAAITNLDMDAMEIRSNGIPSPIFTGLQRSGFSHFINRNVATGKTNSSVGPLYPGDSILIFTDGILDPNLGITRKDLEDMMFKYNKMFPGDASTIIKKIIDFPKESIRDDVTLLVISRPPEEDKK